MEDRPGEPSRAPRWRKTVEEEAKEVVPEAVLDPEGESVAARPPPGGHSPFIGFAAGIMSG